MSTPAPSHWLGRNKLISRIGLGGTGQVWRTGDARLEAEVAIRFPETQLTIPKAAIQ